MKQKPQLFKYPTSYNEMIRISKTKYFGTVSEHQIQSSKLLKYSAYFASKVNV